MDLTQVRLEEVEIYEQLVKDVKLHAHNEANRGFECVGFLACGKDNIISARMPLNNHSPDPHVGFFVEPWEQFRAEQKLEREGYEIVGIYHSHPTSEAIPSMMDEAMAKNYRPGELMMIYSVAYDELTCWREENGNLLRVALVYT